MAKLIYDDNGRLLFTKEMKETYTLLMPQMLPVTFTLMQKLIQLEGYKVELLDTNHRGIIDTGLKYVHNDTCYPALLVIGQLIEAVNSGKYDPDKIALMITQTGGGCRASNYIHLLRKALAKAGLGHVPVVSINMSGLEKNPGFSLGLRLIRRMVPAMIYGDLLVHLANQCRPYEVEAGTTDALIDRWTERLIALFVKGRGLGRKQMAVLMKDIAADFAQIALTGEKKVPVGIVGEIYVKFAPLGNNNLEDFLLAEGCEPVVPGLTDFLLFKIDNRIEDVALYGGSFLKKKLAGVFKGYIEGLQQCMIGAVQSQPRFRAMVPFSELKAGVEGYLGYGNKMGEGWLLTAEMIELIHAGVPNIVCTQPFGCLPNHVAGKGMIRRLKDDFPASNIVSIDYDPGATKINQENRIKLMLSSARRAQTL